MSRQDRFRWLAALQRRLSRNKHDLSSEFLASRRLSVEALEDRRMLANFTVTSTAESGAGSLRAAIDFINSQGESANTIDFSVVGTIELSSQPALPTINTSVEINGPGADQLTIDVDGIGRVFDFGASAVDVTIRDLTHTGGHAVTGKGGGIRSLATGMLQIEDSVITGNRTRGQNGDGAGIYSFGPVTLIDSTVSGNTTHGFEGDGAGIFARGDVTLTSSTVSGNTTTGQYTDGGTGDGDGAGIFAFRANVTLNQSTVSGNRTQNVNSDGGGILVFEGDLTLNNSTVTDNHVDDNGSNGGGIAFVTNLPLDVKTLEINSSIVAENLLAGAANDLVLPSNPAVFTLAVNHSLIGDTSNLTAGERADINAGMGNLLDMDPLLGPMAGNGGPTQTHALLPGSPALEAGDPNFDPNNFNPPLNNDQRGAPFDRVVLGILMGIPVQPRIDIGAYEAQGPPRADFDANMFVNGIDFLNWQIGFGTTSGATQLDGDSDHDGDVDASDLAAWEVSYGEMVAIPPIGGAGEREMRGAGEREMRGAGEREMRGAMLRWLMRRWRWNGWAP